jgi:uncharacterized protein YabE (DUF348 family)
VRQRIAQVAVVVVLSVSAIAYGALEKHVTLRVDGSSVSLRTFASTVSEVLERADVHLHANDRIRPELTAHVSDGTVIEIFRAKPIILLLNGRPRQVIVTGQTVEEVITELHLRSSLADYVGPSRSTRVQPGMVVTYREAVGISIVHDGVTNVVITNAGSIRDVLHDLGIALGPQDVVQPGLDAYPVAKTVVNVLRVGTRIENDTRSIPFPTTYKGDPNLERGMHEQRRAGRNGLELFQYSSTYQNNKRVSRKLLGTHTIRVPVARIVAVGTGPHCICTRGTESGKGTWYGASGLIAAHPWLPFGTVVRVTNLANGRTVTVTIRDRGPTGEGRIIDLSDDAFSRLAPLGEGVLQVQIRW